MKPLTLLALLSFAVPLHAAPKDFVRKAQSWMESTDGAKRLAAFRSWMQLGPEEMENYERALDSAEDFHSDRINKLCNPLRADSNPYRAYQQIADELDEERKRVLVRVRTDWKKDEREAKKLDKEMEDVARLDKKVRKAAELETARFDKTLSSHIQAIIEIRKEQRQFEEEPDDLDDDEIHEEILEDHHHLLALEDVKKRLQQTRREVEKLASVEKTNAELPTSWAKPVLKEFATILNFNRSILGLTPLLLEEKLSDASKGHSKDMADLEFFAHESPVPGKKTPWDRAAKAGFQWAASGENIYMGSTQASDAYTAWFHSDGHRFIMMADGPNLLGVGLYGKHWTMMTGTR